MPGRFRRPARSGRAALVLALLALALPGCRARVDVDVAVEGDGAGEVVVALALDPEAAQELIDVGSGLPLEDLSQAGWLVEPPEEGDDGWTRIRASKEFGTPAQLSEVFEEIDGPGGLFQGMELERTKTFARIDYRLRGTLDPTGGFDQFADPELEAALGAPLSDVAEQAGASPAEVSVALEVDLPGELRDQLAGGPSVGADQDVSWSVTLADRAPLPIDVATTSRLVTPLVLRGVAVVAAVLAALVLLGHLLRLLRPESRRRPATAVRPKVAARSNHPAARRPAPIHAGGGASSGPATAPRVVALDAMGVLYREGDDVRKLLIPFARQHGSRVSEVEVAERARALSLGRITTAEFWAGIGVSGDPHQLDQEYLSLHQLSPGVVRFLRALRERGIRAACITNDAAAWAAALRRRHSLEGLIDLWVISGSVGVRKPDAPIFEALRRLAQVPAGEILVIDDDQANLDAARDLGFRTAWFAPDGHHEESNGHAVLRSLDLGDDRRSLTPQGAGPA